MCISLEEWVYSSILQLGVSFVLKITDYTLKHLNSEIAHSDLCLCVFAAVLKVLFITPWLRL